MRPKKKLRSNLLSPEPPPSSCSWLGYIQRGVQSFNIFSNVHGYS